MEYLAITDFVWQMDGINKLLWVQIKEAPIQIGSDKNKLSYKSWTENTHIALVVFHQLFATFVAINMFQNTRD